MSDEPKRRTRRPNLTPLDRIRAQQQNKIALEMERLAVLQYVGEQLAELNALLRDAGCSVSQMAFQQPPIHQVNQPEQFAAPPPQVNTWQPCAWCGGGKPTKSYNVGNGIVQFLCAAHAMIQDRPQVDGEGKRLLTNATEPNYRPSPPILNSAKTIMQPTQQDIQASQAHAQAANGTPQLPEGYEALEDES